MDKLTLEFLTERLVHLETQRLPFTEKERAYLDTYPAMLRHVANTTFDRDSLLTTALMVYGWMPTIPVLDMEYVKGLPNRLNQLKAEGKALDEKELEQLQKFLNNSVVGASKLLHFIRPDIYPIWDSRVSKNLGRPSYAAYLANVQNYLTYQNELANIQASDGFAAFMQRAAKSLQANGVETTDWKGMRMMEFLLFAA